MNRLFVLRRWGRFLLATFLCAAPFVAPCQAQETIGAIHDAAFEKAKADLAARTLNNLRKAVTTTNVATTAPDGFATRIHSTFQDYLNLLSFAINKVDESKDGQSLIIRFNPVREGRNLLAATLTLSKPTIYQPILDAVPEGSRSSVEDGINKDTSDLEDATFAASYSLSSSECGLKTARKCFGRDVRIYRSLVADLLAVAPSPDTVSLRVERRRLQIELRALAPPSALQPGARLMSTPVKDFSDPEIAKALVARMAELEAVGTALEKEVYTAAGFGVLENLVDNQPQFSIEGTYRGVGHFEGPDEWNAGLELQWGQYNVNRLIREGGKTPEAALSLLERWNAAGVGDGKFVMAMNYKHRAAFALSTLEVAGSAVQGFKPIDQKDAAEFSVRLQWGTKIDTPITGKKPRVDLLIEGLRTWEDERRTKNRWVGTATLTIPLGEDLSIPVSLNYANKAEFLGQQDKKFSAHLGITYRIPGLSPIR